MKAHPFPGRPVECIGWPVPTSVQPPNHILNSEPNSMARNDISLGRVSDASLSHLLNWHVLLLEFLQKIWLMELMMAHCWWVKCPFNQWEHRVRSPSTSFPLNEDFDVLGSGIKPIITKNFTFTFLPHWEFRDVPGNSLRPPGPQRSFPDSKMGRKCLKPDLAFCSCWRALQPARKNRISTNKDCHKPLYYKWKQLGLSQTIVIYRSYCACKPLFEI